VSPGRERGSATLVAVAMMALVMSIALGAMVLGSAVIARHRAQASADLAALAAASRLASGGEAACVWASSVAGAMHSVVASCRVEDLDVIVGVDVPVDLGRWGLGSARAAARAGPGEQAG
jgi:secretion/DNA translocation related TadE-like protein